MTLNDHKLTAIELARLQKRPYVVLGFGEEEVVYKVYPLDGLAIVPGEVYIEFFCNQWCEPELLKSLGVLA